jgi:MFS family permease
VLLVVCLATAGWAFAFGIGSQLLSQAMKDLGWSDAAVGWNTAVYYLGIAVAALFVPALMRAQGNGCAAVGMGLAGGTLALFPLCPGAAPWFALRFLNGMAGAMSLVPLETYLGQGTPNGQRSKMIAFYTVALTVGGAAGIGLGLPLYRTGPLFPYWLGGLISSAAGLALWRGLPARAEIPPDSSASVRDLPGGLLGFGSGWAQGFLEGGLVAFLGLYLLGLGMTQDAAGLMIGASLAGVVVMQVPVGWLADRLGRLPVLLGCYGVVIAGLTVLPLCPPGPALACWLFLVGACSGAFYPLGLALLSDRIPEAALPRAYAWFMATECLGSVVGPVVMGVGRDWFGPAAMFGVSLLAVLLVLLSVLAIRCLPFGAGRPLPDSPARLFRPACRREPAVIDVEVSVDEEVGGVAVEEVMGVGGGRPRPGRVE